VQPCTHSNLTSLPHQHRGPPLPDPPFSPFHRITMASKKDMRRVDLSTSQWPRAFLCVALVRIPVPINQIQAPGQPIVTCANLIHSRPLCGAYQGEVGRRHGQYATPSPMPIDFLMPTSRYYGQYAAYGCCKSTPPSVPVTHLTSCLRSSPATSKPFMNGISW
jgi:hypothetical protein